MDRINKYENRKDGNKYCRIETRRNEDRNRTGGDRNKKD
jgi:hypothetical protein